MATKKKISSWITKLKEREKALAKERDCLDDMIYEFEGLKECCERAMEDLISAIDTLSELV